MRTIARFAESSAGRFHAAACERFGTDPAEGLPAFLAVNLRAALHVATTRAERPGEVDALTAWEQAERGR
jgi:hypothetical protein